MLTSYPPSNVNRDDLGRPKTAIMGGRERLRISSQSLKRAWRKSEIFEQALKGHVGTRTKEMGKKIYHMLIDANVKHSDAFAWAGEIAAVFGKLKDKKKKDDPEDKAAKGAKKKESEQDSGKKKDELEPLEIEQLAHFSPEEEAAIKELVAKLAKEKRAPGEDELGLLRAESTAADIALFGRMLASSPAFNVEAAAQVAHAITVHSVAVEDDFFTAVDDLNKGEVDRGAGHLGQTEFGAGLFYIYICLNRELLADNLRADNKKGAELTARTIRAFLEAAVKITPTGKQNSFASRAYASYILAEKGDQQPRSLSAAFLKPVDKPGETLTEAIKELEKLYNNMDRVYGNCADERATLNVTEGTGNLDALLEFCVS